MSQTFNYEMLQLARELRGLTQKELAQAADISQGYLSKLERGEKDISDDDLHTLAKVLALPESFFFRQARRTGLGISTVFYRRKASTSARQLKRLQAEVDNRRIQITELLRAVEIKTPNNIQTMYVDDFDGSVRDIANFVRAQWSLPIGPIGNLVEAIERAGGIVFKFSFGTKDIDAVSRWPDDLSHPLFFLNSDAPADRIRFSLAHELGHVIMHRQVTDELESQANEFAAEFLMPADEIARQLDSLTLGKATALKSFWRVSIAALIRRARGLRRITERQYEILFRQLNRKGWRKIEPAPISPEEPTLIRRLMEVYQTEQSYSIADLARLVDLYEQEFISYYMPEQLDAPFLRIVTYSN